jgi:methylisocitrate lyase
LRSALKATQAVLTDIMALGTQRDRVDEMLTRKELYELLDYDGYDARDRSYFS